MVGVVLRLPVDTDALAANLDVGGAAARTELIRRRKRSRTSDGAISSHWVHLEAALTA